jgi:hypothetical protein
MKAMQKSTFSVLFKKVEAEKKMEKPPICLRITVNGHIVKISRRRQLFGISEQLIFRPTHPRQKR